MVNAISSLSATLIARDGMRRAENDFTQAALNTINSFNAGFNQVSGNTASLDSATLAAASNISPETGMVNMLMAKHAFEANATAFKMANDVQDSVIDILS